MDIFGYLSEKIDIIAICVGIIGSLLNGVLFLVLSKNHSVDSKCMIIYKNLAAIDAFNCLIIPACFVNLKGHQYNLNLEEPKNSILYLFFGASTNIPYLLMILLSIARVMIFRHRLFYTQKFSGNLTSGLSLLCWSGSICVSVGIWIVYLLANPMSRQNVDVLIGLMKYNSSLNIVSTLVAVFLLFSTIMLLESLSLDLKANKTNEEAANIHIVHNELKTAKLMFSLFFVSISVWSTYPIMFSTAFAFCGPYFNHTSKFCHPLQSKVFSDPKTSYALMMFFLCSLSITNAIILLTQKSFKSTLKRIYWNILCSPRPRIITMPTETELMDPTAPTH